MRNDIVHAKQNCAIGSGSKKFARAHEANVGAFRQVR